MVQSSKVVVFKIDEEEYGIEINQVSTIERMQETTSIPKSSESLIGVTTIRGIVTPVFDVRRILLKNEVTYDDHTRIILIHMGEKLVGIVVDEATEVLEIDNNVIQYPSFTKEENSFVKGIADLTNRLIILTDVEKLLNNDESIRNDIEQIRLFLQKQEA